MGGVPSKATPADKRLTENKDKPGLPAGFVRKPWDGSASRWPDAQKMAESCLINQNTGNPKNWKKDACKMPIKEPSGEYNVNAIHAAAAALAGGRGGVQASPAEKKAAAKKLASLYARMHEDPPPSLKRML